MPPARARPALLLLSLLLLAVLAAVTLTAPILATAHATAAPPARFTAPWQPWRSPDGHVALLRPAIAPPTTTALGRVLLRLSLPTRPTDPARDGPGTEPLQLAVDADPACLSGATASRTLDGVRYAVRTATAAGLNHHLAATEFRPPVGPRCYVATRLRHGLTPAPQARVAFRIGADTAETKTAPRVLMPPGAIAK